VSLTSTSGDDGETKYAGFSLPIVVGAGFVIVALIIAVIGIAVTRKRSRRSRRGSATDDSGFVNGRGFNEIELMTTRTKGPGESTPPALPKLNFGPSTPYHGVYGANAGAWDGGAEHAIAESTL